MFFSLIIIIKNYEIYISRQAQCQKVLDGLNLRFVDESFSENEETTDDSVWTVIDRQNLNLHFKRNALSMLIMWRGKCQHPRSH